MKSVPISQHRKQGWCGGWMVLWGLGLVMAGPGAATTPYADVELRQNLSYGTNPSQKLDLLYPLSGPRPLVIYIHGGAWKSGDKRDNPAEFLVREGYAVATVNFRSSTEKPFPGPLQDCRDAILFLKSNATRFNLRADRVGLWGESSGGHIASLLATAENAGLASPPGSMTGLDQNRGAVQAVLSVSGPTNLARYGPTPRGDALWDLFGGEPTPAQLASADPSRYADAGDPPFLLVHGAQDQVVPPEHAEELHRSLSAVGGRSSLALLVGAGHYLGGRQSARVAKLARKHFDRWLKN